MPEIAALASDRPAHDYEGRARLAAFLHKAGNGKTAEFLAGAVLDDEVADGDAVVTAVETLLAECGTAAVPRVLLTVDLRPERSNGDLWLWHVGRMLKQLAPYPEAPVASRASFLLERFPSVLGTSSLIEAWLAVEPAGESVLDAIDHGAALRIFDQVWSAQHLQDAGQQAAAIELAERVLRSRQGSRDHYERAASVLLKADRAAAVPQLVLLAEQNPESAWLAGVMEALDDRDLELELGLRVLRPKALVAHPRDRRQGAS